MPARSSIPKRHTSDPGVKRKQSRSGRTKKKRLSIKRAASDPTIPRKSKSRSKKRASSSAKLCGICLESVKHTFGTTSCGHVFHPSCICPWLKKSHTCPACRRKISANDIKRICEGVYKNKFGTFATANKSWFALADFTDKRMLRKYLPKFIYKYTYGTDRVRFLLRKMYKEDPYLAVMVGLP